MNSNEAKIRSERADEELSVSLPPAEHVREQLERMLESASFRASPRRREMLRFLVEETLAGSGDRLKGTTVAIAVFGRDETFDQQSDPVVRLEARRLRSDLDSYYVDSGSEDPVRISIPKGGYTPRFTWQKRQAHAPAVPPEPDAPPPEITSVANVSTGAKPTVKRRRGHVILAATLLALGGLMAIGGAFIALRGAGSDTVQARTPAIVVLPFEAAGGADDIELIASGVTGELISNLMQFENFRLYSPTAGFREGASFDPEILGRDLGVAFAVSGVVQAEDGQLHLRARLVDVQTSEVRWSGSYDMPLSPGSLLATQRDLANAIATELGEPYGAVNETISGMSLDRVPSMPSYTCILRAYEYRRTFDVALFAPTLACLQEAVVRDPDYPDAWAMLGWLHLDAARMRFAPEAERPAEMAAAFDAASIAVGLDPRNQRALSALSAITFYQGDYATAEDLQREVLALNPHDPEVLAQLGWRLAVRGNREGLEYLEQAVARSANPPGFYFNLIAVYAYIDGDYARALDAAQKSQGAVGLSLVAMSYAKLGNMEAASDALAAMGAVWPLLARDPAAAYRTHQASEEIVEALVEGLREAGWTPPEEPSQ